MWSAKSTSGGFSISFFWPAPDLKNQVQQKKRRAKASKMVQVIMKPADKLTPEPPQLSSVAIVSLTSGTTRAPNNATQGDQTASPATFCPSPIQCDKRESCTKNASDSEKGQQWTQVTGRKRRNTYLPPYWKMRFPVHLRANLHTPSSMSTTKEFSEGEECDTDDGEGSQCTRGSELSPIAARTRSKLKTKLVLLVVMLLVWSQICCHKKTSTINPDNSLYVVHR